jgi:hypothetical protein
VSFDHDRQPPAHQQPGYHRRRAMARGLIGLKAARPLWALHSPTLRTGSILGMAGALITMLGEHFLGDVPRNLAYGVALLCALTGSALIGAYLGAEYLTIRGEHPDVGLTQLWQRARRRPSPTATEPRAETTDLMPQQPASV